MQTVAKLVTDQPRLLNQTSYGSPPIATATSPVAGPTATAFTTTEGVDKLTHPVTESGLYIMYCFAALVSVSNAPTSHYVYPSLTYTIPSGSGGISAIGMVNASVIPTVLKDTDQSALAYTVGLDAKGGTPGDETTILSVAFPVVAAAGSNLVIQLSHVITGACTDGGAYRLGFAITQL